MNEVQQCCLGICSDIDRICRKHHIRYSLCGGSVIGAMLYQGFIPWDDDMDIMMTRKNYDRFLAVYPKERKPYYYLSYYSLNDLHALTNLFARVEDRRTDVIEEEGGASAKGHVFVDITVMDEIPSPAYHFAAKIWSAYIHTILYRMNGMLPSTGWKSFAIRLLPQSVSMECLRKKCGRFENWTRKHSGKKAKRCAELFTASHAGILYDRRLFDHYDEILFEQKKYMIIKDYKQYLFERYGKQEFTLDVPDEEKHSHLRVAKQATDEGTKK